MRLRLKKPGRRGTTMVEAAIVLLVFLMLVLGMIDLGMGVLRYNTLCEAARQGARAAIVRGSTVPPSGVTTSKPYWAPSPSTAYPGSNPYTIRGTNSAWSTDEIAQAISPYLTGVKPSTVSITIEWLDPSTSSATNDPGNRVQVTVSAPWTPLIEFLFGTSGPTLTATSTMPIAY